VPCSYCIYYHTETALFSGAGKEELQEAVALAGITRQWSTVSNGLNIDEKKFQEETRQIMKFLKEKSQKSMTVKN
jgi:alkylhydroperoxidase/carboxymuconolactone decarboxylase family protein YurZ